MTTPADSRISDKRLDEMLANLVSTAKMIGELKTGGVLSEEIALITELRERRAQAVTEDSDAPDASADNAADFIFEHLAKALGLKVWTPADGSETWDGDVLGTLYSILYEARVLDPDTNERAAPPPAQAAGVTEWQSIETAPKDGTPVMVGRFDPNGQKDQPNNVIQIDTWHTVKEDGFEGWGAFNARYWPATHWMPLPEPPAALSAQDREE